MPIHFHKMHGLGNDFMILDLSTTALPVPTQIQAWADRHTGIGFDQLLTFEQREHSNQFNYRIFNADGSEAEQCGNGARCVAALITQRKLHNAADLWLHSAGGVLQATVANNSAFNSLVTVTMPLQSAPPTPLTITTSSKTRQILAVDVGNPHAVLLLDPSEQLTTAEQIAISQDLACHPAFPNGVNCGFVNIYNRHTVLLTVYERGAGATQACGSGACAAVLAALSLDQVQSPVTVRQAGGDLLINIIGDKLSMTGPAVYVYSAELC